MSERLSCDQPDGACAPMVPAEDPCVLERGEWQGLCVSFRDGMMALGTG